jgi:hypothetical protein
MAAIHASAQGRNPWGDIGMCVALPVILNGFGVTVVCLGIGAVLLDVTLPAQTWGIAVSSFRVPGWAC